MNGISLFSPKIQGSSLAHLLYLFNCACFYFFVMGPLLSSLLALSILCFKLSLCLKQNCVYCFASVLTLASVFLTS